MSSCRYCTEDYDGYYKPLDKNGHICVFDNLREQILEIHYYGNILKAKISYCPMCGRKLGVMNDD